jgi:hypothetical protein
MISGRVIKLQNAFEILGISRPDPSVHPRWRKSMVNVKASKAACLERNVFLVGGAGGVVSLFTHPISIRFLGVSGLEIISVRTIIPRSYKKLIITENIDLF